MIKGVLFDMDGVLVDSEEYICEAAITMYKERGLEVQPEDFLPFVGAGEDRYVGGVAEKYGFEIDLSREKARTYEIYCEIIEGKLDPLPGVLDFMETCRGRDLKLAIATSADKIKMNANLEEIGLPAERFDAVVNGLDIERKKPYPDIYKKTASLINLAPETCLVVEDAVNGIEAGKAAGCRCLGLTTSFSAEQLGQADWTAPDLSAYPSEALEW